MAVGPRGCLPRLRRAVSILALAAAVAACDATPAPTPTPPPGGTAAPSTVAGPSATPVPAPGHELYGFLPYWEMDSTIVDHVATTPLSTLALFSVTHAANGSLKTGQQGYKRITGDIGAQLVRTAHAHQARVEIVYTSFGLARNRKLFADMALQHRVIASLVALAGSVGVDGINVDVEGLDPTLVPAYGAFVGALRSAVVGADPSDRVTVATSGNLLGAAMADAAVQAGVDRVFLMGYDYRTGGSELTGATSPMARRDGDERDLPWSLDQYAALGVPPGKLLLGLPLYGVTWPVAGPVLGAPATGRGAAWILEKHADLLLDPSIVPVLDDLESVDVYFSGSDGSSGPPSPSASASATGPGNAPGSVTAPPPAPSGSGAPSASPAEVTWHAVYVDSPATLATKMQLALDRGLAGSGFWAIGYERGLAGYTDLMRRFTSGEPLQ